MINEIELREIASNLYDGGWRISDREELEHENVYNFSAHELDIILEALQDYETAERNTAIDSYIASLN